MAKDKDIDRSCSNFPENGAQSRNSNTPEARFIEIRVKGHLDSKWSQWLADLELRLLDNGEMILFGSIVDQASLMGVLNNIARLNLTLLSVNEIQNKNRQSENK